MYINPLLLQSYRKDYYIYGEKKGKVHLLCYGFLQAMELKSSLGLYCKELFLNCTTKLSTLFYYPKTTEQLTSFL